MSDRNLDTAPNLLQRRLSPASHTGVSDHDNHNTCQRDNGDERGRASIRRVVRLVPVAVAALSAAPNTLGKLKPINDSIHRFRERILPGAHVSHCPFDLTAVRLDHCAVGMLRWRCAQSIPLAALFCCLHHYLPRPAAADGAYAELDDTTGLKAFISRHLPSISRLRPRNRPI